MIKILKFFFLCGTILTLLLGRGYAAVPIPSTPAGACLGAWLPAFNSGDEKLLKAFYDTYSGPGGIEDAHKLRSMIGRIVLLEIIVDEKFEIQALVKLTKEGKRCRFRIRMDENKPSAFRDMSILLGTTRPFPE